MPRWPDDEDDWEDDFEADEGDDFDSSDDIDDATIPCPYCRRPIHEEAERCPHCEQYVSQEDATASRKPWWLLVGVAAGLYAVYRLIAG
jgi:hypothetical protein